jgi:hypothetical protein
MKSCSEISISITLNRRIPLEALALNRLQQLPELRREEWLRNLLMRGFRGECRSMRASQFTAPQSLGANESAIAHTNWLMQTPAEHSLPVMEDERLSHQTVQKKAARADTHHKPFAELAKIIG